MACSHNMVVFRGGENALRDLQPLLGVIPEARLNLVIFHLKKGDTQLAYDLIKGLEPSLPQECAHLCPVSGCLLSFPAVAGCTWCSSRHLTISKLLSASTYTAARGWKPEINRVVCQQTLQGQCIARCRNP